MLGLLIYSYATGTFSSRRIETLTYENVAVRLLCADTHPDHDTICNFRRENKKLLGESFHKVLELAARGKVLKVGDITVAIDGTKILANASKHGAVSHGHAVEKIKEAEEQIANCWPRRRMPIARPLEDGPSILEDIRRRDSSRHCQRAGRRWLVQRYDAGGVGAAVTNATVYAATKRHKLAPAVADLEKKDDPPPPDAGAPAMEIMEHRLGTREGKELYRLRKQTVEPVFGIIKQVLGFRRFSMRGLEKTDLEWTLVTMPYNLKRLFNLGVRLKAA